MDPKAVARWCDARREAYATGGGGQRMEWIEIENPHRLRESERDAIADRCARFNLALYRFACTGTDPDALSAFASAMGLQRRDLTLDADHLGIAPVRVARNTRGAGDDPVHRACPELAHRRLLPTPRSGPFAPWSCTARRPH